METSPKSDGLQLRTIMALPLRNLLPVGKPASFCKAAAHVPRPVKCACGSSSGRRGLLALFIAAAAIPEESASRKALLQEYLRRSKENKEKNDKERLDDFYKRNYKDYFEFIEGTVKDKKEEELSESEKAILEWLRKNRK